LRYWWRATRGAKHTSWRELYEEEGRIWGTTDRKSTVVIRVLDPNLGTPVDPGEPRYALFPAHQAKPNEKPKLYRNGRFRLAISVAERKYAQDVSTALWAWFTFGGLGARTRRGAGALYCDKYAYTWDAKNILGDGRPREWPVLRGGRVVIGKQRLPWDRCWNLVVNLVRDFRQDRAGPRGRSHWPEADEIRSLRGRWEPRHAPRLQGGGFPRARLGLPIVFHFKDRGDPYDNTLTVEPPGGEGDPNQARMASPVIIKPWAVSDREAVPLLVALNAVAPVELRLLQKNAETKPVSIGGRDAMDELVHRAESEWGVRAIAI
jgi:CRISPR-associated protein Cmr1